MGYYGATLKHIITSILWLSNLLYILVVTNVHKRLDVLQECNPNKRACRSCSKEQGTVHCVYDRRDDWWRVGQWGLGHTLLPLLQLPFPFNCWWKLAGIHIWDFCHFAAFRAGDCFIFILLCKTRILAVDVITGQLLWIIEDIQTERAWYLLLEFI